MITCARRAYTPLQPSRRNADYQQGGTTREVRLSCRQLPGVLMHCNLDQGIMGIMVNCPHDPIAEPGLDHIYP